MSDGYRYPVGDYVWEHMTEKERRAFMLFLRLADGRNESDEGYCALGNAGIGVYIGPGLRVTADNARMTLERMGEARLLDLEQNTDELDWRRILRNATNNKASFERLRRLFELASGIDDEEAFDPDERWDLVAEWKRQAERLRELGMLHTWRYPPAPARPVLIRWAKEGGPIPVLEGEEQLALDLPAPAEG